MANIELVIKIDEEIYQEAIKSGYSHLYDEEVVNAVANGIPLDNIRTEIADLEEGISSYHNDRPWVFKDEVLQIIDRYKAESEGKSNHVN